MENALDKLIAEYAQQVAVIRPGVGYELEIRFKGVTADMAADASRAAEQLHFAKTTANTMEFIRTSRDTKTSNISTFTAGKITGTAIQIKTSLCRPVDVPSTNNGIPYRISLAREESGAAFDKVNTSDITVRVKSRVSYQLDAAWRLDITGVTEGAWGAITPGIKKIITEQFSGAKAPIYEIEIERTSASAVSRAEIAEIIGRVGAMIRPHHAAESAYQAELDWIAARTGAEAGGRFKQVCAQAIALTKSAYFDTIYPPEGYFATEKAEGVRAILTAHDGKATVVTSDGFYMWPVTTPGDMILDCEILRDEGQSEAPLHTREGLKSMSIWVFDCMMFRDEDLSREPFEVRVMRIDDAAAAISALALDGVAVAAKKFERLTAATLEEQFTRIRDTPHPYETDGVIITAPGASYTDTHNYKWKPIDKNTIDFLAIQCPAMIIGRPPYIKKPQKTLYLLFVGIAHKMREELSLGMLADYNAVIPESAPYRTAKYYPIQFSPSFNRLAYLWWHDDASMSGKVVEMKRGDDDEWALVRVREDRSMETFGFNNYKVAELTYINYIDPFDFESLYAAGGSYFAGMADDRYRPGNNFRRYVITQLIEKWFSGVNWVIDMAAGRGADLHRFGETGVKNIVCMDIDSTGIAELIRRKYEISAKLSTRAKRGGGVLAPGAVVRESMFTSAGVDRMSVYAVVQDLTAPVDECVAAATKHGEIEGQVDAIACMFAFHYFCRDTDTISRVLQFVVRMLKPGGVFMFTTMDGGKIFKLFSGGSRSLKRGGGVSRWELAEPGELDMPAKYAIERRFESNNLTAAGQMIAVKLPFSDEMREEPLANIKHILAAAKEVGLVLETNGGFDGYLPGAVGLPFYKKLTDNDKTYIGLHSYVVLRKKMSRG